MASVPIIVKPIMLLPFSKAQNVGVQIMHHLQQPQAVLNHALDTDRKHVEVSRRTSSATLLFQTFHRVALLAPLHR